MTLPTLDFVRPDGKKLEFEIVEISETVLKTSPIENHRHNFYEILVITKNDAKHTIDFQSFTVKEDEILIIPKNSVHKTEENQKYSGLWLLFTDAFLSMEQSKILYRLSVFNPLINNKLIKINEENELSKYLEIINSEYLKNENDTILLQNLLFTFLLKLENVAQNQYQTANLVAEQNVYIQFISLLENNFKSNHNVTYYSENLNVTSKKLNSILTKITGKTASELIIDRIIIEAKRLLAYSDLSIKEIAYFLGFDDNHYFSRIFKKKVLLSPELFKKSLSQKSIKTD